MTPSKNRRRRQLSIDYLYVFILDQYRFICIPPPVIILAVSYSCSALHNYFESLVPLPMTTLSFSPGSTYSKADDIIVFARGPRAFSRQQIKNLIYSTWLPGYCRPSYKGGERGWGGVGWGCELLPEARNDSSSNGQMNITLPTAAARDKKKPLVPISHSLSPSRSDLIFFSASRDICITHAFPLNANQLFSPSVFALAPTGGSGRGSCSKVRLLPALLWSNIRLLQLSSEAELHAQCVCSFRFCVLFFFFFLLYHW